MPDNPIKGEGVEIEINGKSYPLIFSLNSIASIETSYDKIISEIQLQMPRVSVIIDLLAVSLVGFDGDLKHPEIEMPPLVETQALILKALAIAYYGAENAEEIRKAVEADAKKKAKK